MDDIDSVPSAGNGDGGQSATADNEHGDTASAGDGELSTLPSDRESITMEVTVPVDDMNSRDRQALRELARIYEESFMEVVEKNRDYGWSFLTTGSKLAASDGTPFVTPARSQAYGLLTRSGDKRERVVENIYGDGDAAVSDPPAVTAQECGNYWFFLALVLDNPQLAASFGQP